MTSTAQHTENHQDISGFRVFAAGDIGALHVLAHRMLDEHRNWDGYLALSEGLQGVSGAGSEWVHIQWHLMVFELAVGKWAEARARFEAELLPVAACSRQALTDAPAGLWRLALAAPDSTAAALLPWSAVHGTAVAALPETRDPYVVLHHLLAFAGAGDVARLDAFAGAPRRRKADAVLQQMARALAAHVVGDFAEALTAFRMALPELSGLGGSYAQNGLFYDICEVSRRSLVAAGGPIPKPDPILRPVYPVAA